MIKLQMGWLDVVKKAFGSPTKTIKGRHEHQHQAVIVRRKKNRWVLKKTCYLHETTTIILHLHLHHDQSIPAYSYSFEKHEEAALIIQTSFRGYLARRALQALKGVVKLQALVRGHNVRKRAKMTLKYMEALLRVQARVCDQRRQLSTLFHHQDSIREEGRTRMLHKTAASFISHPISPVKITIPASTDQNNLSYKRSPQQQIRLNKNPFSSPSQQSLSRLQSNSSPRKLHVCNSISHGEN